MTSSETTSSCPRVKVLVTGCFDLLHSGHMEFFRRAAEFGELHVALGSDRTVLELKGRPPVNSERERCFMVQNVSCVHQAFISSGSGLLDFEQEMRVLRPDVFVVNEEGNTPAKRKLCEDLGARYVVLERIPHQGLDARSTTALRNVASMPYRIDLAGGWLDQPFVSKHHPGSVITISIEPVLEFNERSGMATSTRRTALKLWGQRLPVGPLEKTAWTLFCCDNPPGRELISGSQDAIGIVYPGLARAHYSGAYWPDRIEHVLTEDVLRFIETHLYLLPLGPRGPEFDVLGDTHIDASRARALAIATDQCWDAISAADPRAFGKALTAAFDAQIEMFPRMVTAAVLDTIEQVRGHASGWKVSGAGGGGYLIAASEKPIDKAIRCVIRRSAD